MIVAQMEKRRKREFRRRLKKLLILRVEEM
jgi:hypothetical protein